VKEDKKLLEKVKKLMITKYPRFAQEIASANLEYKTDLPSKTAATDGKNIYFDPNFLQNLSDNDKLFIVAHELMHIKFEHMFRMTDKNGEKRNLKYWNIATDAIINANLERDGFKIMEGAVNMPEALNYSAEEFYEKLLKQKQSSGGQNGQNQQSQNQNNKNSDQNGQGQNQDKQNNNAEQNGQNSDNKQSDSKVENNQKNGEDSRNNEQHENNNQEQNQSTKQDNNNNQNNSKFSGDGQKQNSQELDDEFADDHSLWEKAFEESRQGNKEQKENKQNNLDKQENNQNEKFKQNQEKKQPQNKDKNKNQSEKDKEEKQDSSKNEQNESKNLKQRNLDSNENEIEFDEAKLNEKAEFEQNRQERKERAKQKFEKMKDQELKKTDDSNINLGEIGEAKAILDWKLLLRREFDKTETLWSQRRSIAENNYAYRLEEYDVEDEAETEVMIDVSGSVSNSLVRAFLRQLKPILKSSKVKVGFFADYATSQSQFQEIKNDRDINNLKIYRPGEGTNMDAAVKAFSKRPEVNKIVFTDGYAGKMPSKETKNINVFWLVYGDKTYNPCCGKVFQISEEEFTKLSFTKQDNLNEDEFIR